MESVPEQRLFKRITTLTLLLGILIGILVVFMGVLLYDFFQSERNSFLVAPWVHEWLEPLIFILLGVISILRWKLRALRAGLPASLQTVDRFEAIETTSFLLISGLFFIGMGGWWIIAVKWLNPGITMFSAVLMLGFVGMLVADWFISRRSNRRAAQQQRGWEP